MGRADARIDIFVQFLSLLGEDVTYDEFIEKLKPYSSDFYLQPCFPGVQIDVWRFRSKTGHSCPICYLYNKITGRALIDNQAYAAATALGLESGAAESIINDADLVNHKLYNKLLSSLGLEHLLKTPEPPMVSRKFNEEVFISYSHYINSFSTDRSLMRVGEIVLYSRLLI